MTIVDRQPVPLHHVDRFFIGGAWVEPTSDAVIDVIDPATEERFLRVPGASPADVARAVAAARAPSTEVRGPPSATPSAPTTCASWERRWRTGRRISDRSGPGSPARSTRRRVAAGQFAGMPFDAYAALADTFPFEERAQPTMGGVFGLLVREPVGVVGAIIPWNAPLSLISHKIGPALLAGCTVVLKLSPEAPGEGYLVAEAAEAIGLPPGVLNVITAERDVSELLVRDPGVDKITFTGSTATGRRIASLCGERIARCTLELGGKSAAVILDDADLEAAAETLARSECFLAGQVCSSLTRIVVSEHRHDEFVDALAAAFSAVQVGDPFDPSTQIGPLTSARQRDRVEGYIAKGIEEGATLVTGGGRPGHLDRGWFVEPTVFSRVDNASTIAQEEIFGPVLGVIPAADEDDMVAIANDTIYGLNASVFTREADRARDVARRLRSGTVGHNAWRPTSASLSAGSSSRASAARVAGRVCCPSSRPRPSFSKRCRAGTSPDWRHRRRLTSAGTRGLMAGGERGPGLVETSGPAGGARGGGSDHRAQRRHDRRRLRSHEAGRGAVLAPAAAVPVAPSRIPARPEPARGHRHDARDRPHRGRDAGEPLLRQLPRDARPRRRVHSRPSGTPEKHESGPHGWLRPRLPRD